MEQFKSQHKIFKEDESKYHSSDYLGSSDIRNYLESKNKFLYCLNNKGIPSTESMEIGSALHCFLLEPETFETRYAISEDIDRRTKLGREFWEKFQNENDGKTFIKSKNFEMIKKMKENILGNKTANELLEGCAVEMCSRVTLTNGLKMQCRADAIKKNHIIDIKTCQNVNAFKYDIKKQNYHLQSALYYFILKNVDPENFSSANFYFIASEKTDFNECKIFGIDNENLEFLIDKELKPLLNEISSFIDGIEDVKKYKHFQEEIEWINI